MYFILFNVIDSGTSQKVTVSASLSRFLSSSPILFPDYLTRLPSLFSFSPLLPHISLFLPSFLLYSSLYLFFNPLSDPHPLSDKVSTRSLYVAGFLSSPYTVLFGSLIPHHQNKHYWITRLSIYPDKKSVVRYLVRQLHGSIQPQCPAFSP